MVDLEIKLNQAEEANRQIRNIRLAEVTIDIDEQRMLVNDFYARRVLAERESLPVEIQYELVKTEDYDTLCNLAHFQREMPTELQFILAEYNDMNRYLAQNPSVDDKVKSFTVMNKVLNK